MELWVAKVCCLFTLEFVLLAAALLPIKVSDYFVKKGPKGLEVISNLMIFGGGIFLSTFLLFMVPEVRHLLTHSWLDNTDINYPIPELVIGSGFFLIMVIQLALKDWSDRDKPKQTVGRERTITCVEVTIPEDSEETQVTHFGGTTYSSQKSMEAKSSSNTYSLAEAGSDGTNTSHNNNTRAQADAKAKQDTKVEDDLGKDNEAFTYAQKDLEAQTMDVLTDRAPAKTKDQEAAPEMSVTKSLILLVALSVDNIFTGMSLGLQYTLHGTLARFIAILSHESVIGFSLGLQLVKDNDKLSRIVTSAVLYSFSIPTGVSIGIIIMETSGGSDSIDIVNGTLQGITAGIFLYVTFFLILCDELAGRATWTRVGYLLLGFSFMASIAMLEPAEEDLPPPGDNTTITEYYYRGGYSRSAIADWILG